MMLTTSVIPLRWLLLAQFFWVAGCGYSIIEGNPPLPNRARSLGIVPVQNQTYVADLETKLSAQLKDLLRANASLKLLPPGQADLLLSITLLELKTRTSGLGSLEDAGGVTYALRGLVELEERESAEMIWVEKELSVELTEIGGDSLISLNNEVTSSNLNELTALFAHRIYDRLFLEF